MSRPLNIALLEPYYGGSHALFCDTLAAPSRHRIRLVTMPARKWKWRMRGAAIWFTRDHPEWLSEWPIDAILCSDMVSVADLRALLPPEMRNVPIACYFHENQLTYPLQPGEERDLQYGMTNITSALAADAVWFNSVFHRSDFLRAAGELLRQMPDCVPSRTIEEIAGKSAVLPPPIDVGEIGGQAGRRPDGPPVILWCHRWEYDKNPAPFFRALLAVLDRGADFEIVLLGEQFREAPSEFRSLWEKLKPRIKHCGFVQDRGEYLRRLQTCDIVVSTAIQEFCGLAVIEAMLAGCQPLLPNRLAYPELIPPALRATCLYQHDGHLEQALWECVRGERRLDGCSPRARGEGSGVTADMQRELLTNTLRERFGAKAATPRIDEALAALVERQKKCFPGWH